MLESNEEAVDTATRLLNSSTKADNVRHLFSKRLITILTVLPQDPLIHDPSIQRLPSSSLVLCPPPFASDSFQLRSSVHHSKARLPASAQPIVQWPKRTEKAQHGLQRKKLALTKGQQQHEVLSCSSRRAGLLLPGLRGNGLDIRIFSSSRCLGL